MRGNLNPVYQDAVAQNKLSENAAVILNEVSFLADKVLPIVLACPAVIAMLNQNLLAAPTVDTMLSQDILRNVIELPQFMSLTEFNQVLQENILVDTKNSPQFILADAEELLKDNIIVKSIEELLDDALAGHDPVRISKVNEHREQILAKFPDPIALLKEKKQRAKIVALYELGYLNKDDLNKLTVNSNVPYDAFFFKTRGMTLSELSFNMSKILDTLGAKEKPAAENFGDRVNYYKAKLSQISEERLGKVNQLINLFRKGHIGFSPEVSQCSAFSPNG